MTSTIDDIEVEFVLWEAEDPFDHPCEAEPNDVACPNRATYRLYYSLAGSLAPYMQECRCGALLMCIGCKDRKLADPPDTLYECNTCDGFTMLKRIEPIY